MPEPEPRTICKSDWLLIGVLIALVLPLRLWLICNTEVTARDSIGYIRYALQFEKHSWKEVLTSHHQHPGYPFLVYLASMPVRAIDGATTPENMELSAQLVNFVASLLLILPMYFLGRQFFDRPVSFLATLLYQYLPISAQHLSDGISEPLFLLLMVSGLLQAVHAVRDRTVWRCQLCGLFTGLAYLTRPEGALILPAFGCVLIVLQLLPAWRCTWQRFFECGISTATSAALVGAIYVGATGQLTNKPAANVMMGKAEMTTTQTSEIAGHLFAASFTKTDHQGLRFTRSVWALISEINQGFHYIAGIPALLGMLWSFRSMRNDPGCWVVLAFVAILGSILISLAMVVSYVSDRHVMILVLLGCFFVAAGLRELPRRVLAWRRINENTDVQTPRWRTWLRSEPAWFAILFIALIGIGLPKATQRLHGNRASNHEAGEWLAKHIDPKDNVVIVDDHSWSHFFAGLVFQEDRKQAFPRDHPSKCYIVTTRSRDPGIDEKRQAGVLSADAKIVWPESGDLQKARVVIYSQPRVYEKYPWPTPSTANK